MIFLVLFLAGTRAPENFRSRDMKTFRLAKHKKQAVVVYHETSLGIGQRLKNPGTRSNYVHHKYHFLTGSVSGVVLRRISEPNPRVSPFLGSMEVAARFVLVGLPRHIP